MSRKARSGIKRGKSKKEADLISDINGAKRQTFFGSEIDNVYKLIAETSPDSSTYINVRYSTGQLISFGIVRDKSGDGKALRRFSVTNPLAFKTLKFKSHVTVKNNILKEGKGGFPIEVVVNPNKSELDINIGSK